MTKPKNPIDIEIGKRMKGFRKWKGFDRQERFAEALGIPISTYRYKESGHSGFLFREIIKASELLQIPITDLAPIELLKNITPSHLQ